MLANTRLSLPTGMLCAALRAQRGGQEAAHGNHGQRRQPDVAKSAFGQVLHGLAADDVAQHIGQGNRKTQRGRGGDGIVNRNVAPGHEGHADKTAASADQARQKTDKAACGQLPARAGHLARRLGFFVQKHLRGRKTHEQAKKNGQVRAL